MSVGRGARSSKPRNFFLNEQHELARAQKEGGGRAASYGNIDWAAKGEQISSALRQSRMVIQRSKDPLKEKHYFLVALPVAKVPKLTKDKRSKTGIKEEETRYEAEHSRVFRRLGMDLLDVAPNGVAVVHATPDRFERLLSTASVLAREGVQERARWATLDRFEPVPTNFRVDSAWVDRLPKKTASDVIVELQPLLSRAETEDVLIAVSRMLQREAGELVSGTGTDFSGRRWFRSKMRQAALLGIAENFFSVQSMHPPHFTAVGAKAGARERRTYEVRGPAEVSDLPTVAILDTGVPAAHPVLDHYRRGTYQSPDAFVQYAGDHGSTVASRVVFGELDFSEERHEPPSGTCRFLDVMIARDDTEIDNKAVMPAIEAIIATYPDVRVFNLSFSDVRPRASYSDVELRERLLLVQDLDNLIFARDVFVVIAAGNSPRGVRPTSEYPFHVDEPAWQLGAWPSGFNTATCGAVVGVSHPEGLVGEIGWPSPYSRVGPGLAGAPIPEFGAAGGNISTDWSWSGSMGVWACTAAGAWEDRIGTSLAAPLLAREAAFAFQALQAFCPPGTRPFAVLVKAFLALTAERADCPAPVEILAKRTIGRGTGSAGRLLNPHRASAVLLWQGVIDGTADVVRVQLPIPNAWLAAAKQPKIKLVCSWEPPVHEAVKGIWACRRVFARLRPAAGSTALRGSTGGHSSYPIIERTYDLSRKRTAQVNLPPEQLWLLELSYDQIAEYYPGITFAPYQRVALAAELFDEGESPVSPQLALQALPVAATMNRLATLSASLPVPVVVRVN